MAKIKLNLTSGASVEKSLLSAFKVNENSYVIFDNEMTGSAGLPIILVCKLAGDKIVKIEDPNEWQQVKEYLKNIIAGTPFEFINIPAVNNADDIYYTQLTLPVPSFDSLKNAYVVTNTENIAPVENPTPEVTPQPVTEATPVTDQLAQVTSELENINPTDDALNGIETPNVEPIAPVIPETPPVEVAPVEPQPAVASEIGINDIQPNIDLNAPVVDIGIQNPTPQPEVNPAPIESQPVEPIIPETPAVESQPVVEEPAPIQPIQDNIFSEQKEAFMQACENMFDALVQKFEKELEKRN